MVQRGGLLRPLAWLVSPKVELYKDLMVNEECCLSSISCRNERTTDTLEVTRSKSRSWHQAVKSRPFQIIEASGRRGSSFCHCAYDTLWEVERLPLSGHTCRVYNSGCGCHSVPFGWERRSCLKGIGHGAASSSWKNSTPTTGSSKGGLACAVAPWLAWVPAVAEIGGKA